MELINMYNFGDLVSTHEYWIDIKTKVVLYMEYFKPEIDLFIDIAYIEDEDKTNESYYKVTFTENGKITSTNIRDIDQDLQYLMLIKNLGKEEHLNPEIYTYESAKNKTKDMYTITYNTGKRDVQLTLSKDKAAVKFNGLGVMIYPVEENEISFSKRIETYQFSDDYYFNNIDTGQGANETFSNSDCTIYFKDIVYGVHESCYPITCYPREINYKNGLSFKIEIDTVTGIILKIINTSDPKSIIYRTESKIYSDTDYEISSIFPNMYEIFDKESNNNPYVYWAEQRFKVENGIVTINKNIYKVSEDKLDKLFKLLKDTHYVSEQLINIYELHALQKI